MKTLTYILVAASIMLTTSCNLGNKADAENTNSLKADTLMESTEVTDEPEMLADGVDVAPEDQWTEEAVEKQLKKIYTEVSKAYASGKESNTDLDGMFCTTDFNELQRQVRVINAKKSSNKLFENEQIRWTYGLDLPVTPKNIKVNLLTGNIAEATFELSSGEQWMYTKLTLDREDNQWKIRTWNEVGDNSSDLYDEMYKYVEANK
ncbi:MAG: hypothetical protein J6T38_00415 [Bacteroidaceae bacterium]|nr:hypothetical protein [Bacteroidaceae bacterium]